MSFLLLNGSAAHQHTDRLFEIQQPEREHQIVDIEEFGALAECVRVFVMWVENDDVRIWVVGQNIRGSSHKPRINRAVFRSGQLTNQLRTSDLFGSCDRRTIPSRPRRSQGLHEVAAGQLVVCGPHDDPGA